MSRTRKGSKGSGYDFWSRRAGNYGANGHGSIAKQITHRKERVQNNRIIRQELKLATISQGKAQGEYRETH